MPIFGFDTVPTLLGLTIANAWNETKRAPARRFLDNLYPYGYSDDGQSKIGVAKKVALGMIGKSDKRKAVDEFVKLDLNTPEGNKRGLYLKNRYFNNFYYDDLQEIQESMRARLDANDLYLGRPQTYGTWKVNEEYQSPTAKANGVPTYTYADERIRKKHLRMAALYGRNNGVGVHAVNGDPLTVFNRYSINTMHKDGSGRYMDKWDFFGDLPGTNLVIIGDTIPPGIGGSKGIYKTTDDSPINETYLELNKSKNTSKNTGNDWNKYLDKYTFRSTFKLNEDGTDF